MVQHFTFSRHEILFEDRWLLIVNKPAGVLSHPNPETGSPKKTVSAFEGSYSVKERCFNTPGGPVWLIHRIDQDTSGVLLAARDADTAAACRILFDEGRVEKKYSALILGKPLPARGLWRDSLRESRGVGRVRTFVSGGGAPNAELRYAVKKYFPRRHLSLLDLELVTGRTHQIRVQTAYRKHPVAGDDVYGNFTANRELRRTIGLKRLFLHAHSLAFKHPRTGKPFSVFSPFPKELETVLEQAS